MGTAVSFELRTADVPEAEARAALVRACAVLHRADAVFSTWQPESPTSRLRRGEITLADCPAEVAEVLERCERARALSGGAFDPWAMPGGVDPTGLVKGWAAQRALGELRWAGLDAAMVNAGGDIATFGRPAPDRAWRVGIRDPRDEHALLCVVAADGAVATTGAYERGDHVLDPLTGLPARGALSATVTGLDLALADALATGLLVDGEAGLTAVAVLDGYGAMVLRPDGVARAAGAFAAESPAAAA